jgi:hypothetical protein
MHIVLRRENLPVRAASTVEAALRAAAAGRPLIIDFFTVRTRGRSIGDLIVGFDTARLGPAFVEVDPIADVPVVVEGRLLDVLRRGAAIVHRPWWWPFGARFWVRMDHPEDWIGFLDGRP